MLRYYKAFHNINFCHWFSRNSSLLAHYPRTSFAVTFFGLQAHLQKTKLRTSCCFSFLQTLRFTSPKKKKKRTSLEAPHSRHRKRYYHSKIIYRNRLHLKVQLELIYIHYQSTLQEISMGLLIAVGSKICEYTFGTVARKLGYIYHYKRNVDNVKSKIQRLKGEKARMQHSIEEAGRNGEEIEGAVEEWINEVTGIIEKANDEFFKDEDYAMPLCSSKLFPNLVSRRRLSKIANSLAETAGDEMQPANTLFQKVSYRLPPQSAAIDMTKGGYMIFQSRTSTFNRIMEALRNPGVKMIGVYGMGGVGKTMLAKEVARKAVDDDRLFKKAVIVTVSQTPDPHKIQKEIADQLGLKFGDNENDKNVRAKRLRQQLGREEKMLHVIDDIWEKLELYEVGIAFGNDKNDCKILLTSRSQDVVCNDMDANLNFVLDDLRFDEAKDLFDKIVGDQLIRNPEIQALAIEIVKECAGLPIALETVASALKKKDYPIWSNALRELRRSAPTNIKGMNKNVYSSIKLSYDFLESTEAKSLLLICSLFPEDAVIGTEVWLKYVMGLPELFQSIKNLEEAREKVLALVDILKASSLLLNVGSNMDEIKMHDVVRDVVILIGSEEYNMFCLRNVDELEDNKKLKVATAISLPNFEGDAHQLPKSLECPQLVFFHICNLSFQKNRNFQIPNHFFEAMKELKVLDLTSVCLKPLPSSFEFLKNLHTLFLNNCEIEDVALIGELRNLKILDLSYSKIRNLPGQIGQLTRLQSLGLSYCSKLEVIECNVISNLVHLEELYMFESFTRWDIEVGSGRRNASLMELKNLSRLTTLYLDIPDVNVMPKDLFSMNLKRYGILIAGGPRYLDKSFAPRNPSSRKLELIELNISRFQEFHGLEMLVKRSEVLNLYGSTGLNNVIHELDREGFPELKHLKIVNNDEMQYIIGSMDQRYHSQNAFFQSLESLRLENLKKLEKIWHDELLTNSFGQLRVVEVKDCERLKNLLSSSRVREIEKIKVINCKMMSEIVTYGRKEGHPHLIFAKIEFPHLRSLILKSSPNLAHFPFSELEAAFTGHRKEEEPLDVNRPLPFFYPMVALPSLKDLELSTLNSEKLLPDHPPENFNMQNLTNLKIHGCNSLKYLLSFAMARKIAQLEHLEVRGCSVMEDVLVINDKERMEKEKLLPNLKLLVLDDLPNLERFCSKSWAEFSSLDRLRITNCPKLEIEDSILKLPRLKGLILKQINVAQKALWNYQYEIDHEGLNVDDQEHAAIFLSLKFLILDEVTDRLMDSWKKHYHPAGRAFQNLKCLLVFQCHTLKNLIRASISFQALRILEVSKCHGMEYLLTPSAARSLTQLRKMLIEKCEKMIQIIADYNGSEAEEGTEIVFHRLEELVLGNLQNLRSFYSGNCVMRFPNLKRLIFKYCPQMVSFCDGNISTPKLKKLILSIDEDGDEGEDVDVIFDTVMEFDFDFDEVVRSDNYESSSFQTQQLEEGDINAATRKLLLNNQG
ncbi:disease resistance protein At4g27190 isoform X2 [Ziziphus jujuba]|uniref:Disease resistance protein At4g27190 isoform X2 n=1 Tax=Ziziphus jujuba TaxID=326968 RepID=A0ABM4AF82_ZIZJJ|nr:disease resistance protein At4g27190 isoform X2 [Ziziphus jujuba]